MSKLYFRLSLTRQYGPLETYSTGYHGIGLEAHIFANYENSISLFLSRLNKPYFIDPVFYRFTSPLYRNYTDRRWAGRLIESYGLTQLLEENPDGIMTSNITEKNISAITGRVLDYQRNSLMSSSGETISLLSLLDDTESTSVDVTGPEFLIPPYFIYDGDGNVIKTNLSLVDESLKLKRENERIFAPIIVDPDSLLDSAFIDGLISKYSAKEVDGYVVWITDFKEYEADSLTLEYYTKFLKKLKKSTKNREIIDLFSGFYSVLLASSSYLDGVVQGLGISESKNPFAGSGQGKPRYYIPIAKQMVSVDIATDLISVDKLLFSCGCSGCSSNSDILHKNIRELDDHFIENRINEFENLSKESISIIVNGLDSDSRKLNHVVDPTASGLAHRFGNRLRVWATALSNSP